MSNTPSIDALKVVSKSLDRSDRPALVDNPQIHAATAVTESRRTRRPWDANDYRIRGLKTPEERNRAELVTLTTKVKPTTRDRLRNMAGDAGVTLGDLIDTLVEGL